MRERHKTMTQRHTENRHKKLRARSKGPSVNDADVKLKFARTYELLGRIFLSRGTATLDAWSPVTFNAYSSLGPQGKVAYVCVNSRRAVGFAGRPPARDPG